MNECGALVTWYLTGWNHSTWWNMSQYYFIHHKCHMGRPGIKPGHLHWKPSNCLRHDTASSIILEPDVCLWLPSSCCFHEEKEPSALLKGCIDLRTDPDVVWISVSMLEITPQCPAYSLSLTDWTISVCNL